MYTQCPDCSTAFRVTAGILKQAAGKVRCGGCGCAFNALEYLSEAMPEAPATKESEAPVPELTPEPVQSDEGMPQSISAEQSAALLKTLDDLAGSDIRIEDTGVEWRVLDVEESSESGDEADVPGAGENDYIVDELLDESPTPVDQFLTRTPNDIEASEIFEASANAPAQTPVDELRFDDNTPLPDEFNLDDEASYLPESAEPGETGDATTDEKEFAGERALDTDQSSVDIELGEPDEWADILDEFAEPPEPYVAPLEAELAALEENEPGETSDGEPAALDESDKPLDVDTQFALQAEAMGIDLSGIHAKPTGEPDARNVEDVEEPVMQAATDEYDDRQDDASLEATGEAPGLDDEDQTGEAPHLHLDEELDEAPEAEADEADDDGDRTGEAPHLHLDDEVDEAPEAEATEPVEEEDEDRSGETPHLRLEDETGEPAQLEASSELDDEYASTDEESDTVIRDLEDDDADASDQDEEESPLEFASVEEAMAELEEQSDVFDTDFFGDAALDEAEIEDPLHGDAEDRLAASADTSHYVPPQTEEEQTLNLLIDQDLLSLAVEDEDGFSSTIVVPEQPVETRAMSDKTKPAIAENEPAGFESIVMEGETVRSALDHEKREADIAEARALAEQAKARAEEEESTYGSRSNRGMIAAAITLVVLLMFQVVHQSREALATIPAFNDVIGPVYRAIGKPLSPTWDVTGWRFEARRDAFDDDANRLTIISRIGNTSAKPLPYPLINVTLTDRFEETIGNKTLDPGEYLSDDLDPSTLVQPGNNFTAVMSIEGPSEAATGYKLQACYRQPDAFLRCHIPDFR